VTLLCVVHLKMGVLGFGVAQAAYGASHFLSLLFTTWGSSQALRSFLPAAVPPSSGGFLHLPMVSTALHMTGTSLLKHFLTEGDRIILSFSTNHYDQGIYAVTYNYGSLVARLLFQPIEESSRISFAQLAGAIQSVGTPVSQTREGGVNKKALVEELRGAILKLLRAMFFLGSLFSLLGPLYARLLVRHILGERWYSEDAVRTISAFCIYLGVMGCNGVSEAFVQSVAPPHLFGTMNRSLFLSSLVFYASSPLLISSYGTVGLIFANCLSMLLRTLLNLHFISSYFSEQQSEPPLSASAYFQLFFSTYINLALLVVRRILVESSAEYARSSLTLVDAAHHIAKGGSVSLFAAAIVGFIYREDLSQLLRGFRADQTQAHAPTPAPPPRRKKDD
jgi:hypothetical protein